MTAGNPGHGTPRRGPSAVPGQSALLKILQDTLQRKSFFFLHGIDFLSKSFDLRVKKQGRLSRGLKKKKHQNTPSFLPEASVGGAAFPRLCKTENRVGVLRAPKGPGSCSSGAGEELSSFSTPTPGEYQLFQNRSFLLLFVQKAWQLEGPGTNGGGQGKTGHCLPGQEAHLRFPRTREEAGWPPEPCPPLRGRRDQKPAAEAGNWGRGRWTCSGKLRPGALGAGNGAQPGEEGREKPRGEQVRKPARAEGP